MKDPVPFVKRSDYLFRPWKIYASECKNIKKSVDTSSKWTMKANENLKFLKRIFRTVDCKKSFLDSGTKMLWSTTYLIALRDCERFASVGDVNRKLITAMIPDPNDWMKLLELACWVWSERFLRSGYELEMGCNIMVDLLEVT